MRAGEPTNIQVTDPRILESRAVYDAIEAGSVVDSYLLASCEGVSLRIERDGSGIARKLTRVLGDGTSGSTYFYDANGVLRFSFHWHKSIDRSHESRVYFDAVGAQFHRVDRKVSGPAYTGGYELAIRDPEERFAACGAP